MVKFPTKGSFDRDVRKLRKTQRNVTVTAKTSAEALLGAIRNPALNTLTAPWGNDTFYPEKSGSAPNPAGGRVMDTIYGGSRVMDTIYGGGRVMDTIYGGSRVMDTIYGGSRFMDTVYGGGRVMDTVYGGGRVMDTVYGGGRFMDTVYGGGRVMDTIYGGVAGDAVRRKIGGWNMDTVYGGGPDKPMQGLDGSARIITATVIDPGTRGAISVAFDRHTNSYLDKKLNRWISAPGWMRNQIR